MSENKDRIIKVLFVTGNGYTVPIYVNMLSGLNKISGIRFTSCEGNANWKDFDVILLMYECCDKFLRDIRQSNPECKIGVVDPRRADGEILNADFAVVQGIEEENWFSDYYFDIFRYDFHPIFPCKLKKHTNKKKIMIGYHGNKVHLQTMYPYLTTAIEALADDFEIEFRAYYNIKLLGHVEFDLFPAGKVDFKEIQWEWDIFTEDMINVDIGVVPNLIPIKNISETKEKIKSYPEFFNEQETDMLIRYKGTSNIARLYPFAQLGIPVVADMYPSSCAAIIPSVTGFFGGSAGLWYRSLYKLASSAELRNFIGKNLQDQYLHSASADIFNNGLSEFLFNVVTKPTKKIPSEIHDAENKLSKMSFNKKLKKNSLFRSLHNFQNTFLKKKTAPGEQNRMH